MANYLFFCVSQRVAKFNSDWPEHISGRVANFDWTNYSYVDHEEWRILIGLNILRFLLTSGQFWLAVFFCLCASKGWRILIGRNTSVEEWRIFFFWLAQILLKHIKKSGEFFWKKNRRVIFWVGEGRFVTLNWVDHSELGLTCVTKWHL